MAATTDDDRNGVSNETEAVLRQNGVKLLVVTQAQYDALGTYDSTILYIITA